MYLNLYYPGWFWRVSPSLLNMKDTKRCIGGQLEDYDHFEKLCTKRGFTPYHLGFNVETIFWTDETWEEFTEKNQKLFNQLTGEWRATIIRLRAAPVAFPY